jgi:hypothetical protein
MLFPDNKEEVSIVDAETLNCAINEAIIAVVVESEI